MNRQVIIDILAAGRVANLPSVVSNVVLGAVVFGVFGQISWPAVAGGCGCGMFLYLGGCFLNDWWDRNWDKENKPDRAVPSGRLSGGLLLGLAIFCFVIGMGLSLVLGPIAVSFALLIVVLILVYSFIHKRTSFGVIPMGLCRALLYFLGFFSANPEFYLWEISDGAFVYYVDFTDWVSLLFCPAIGLLSYIAGLSLLARHEARGDQPSASRVVAYFLLFLPILTHAVWTGSQVPLLAVLSALPFLIVVFLATRRIKTSIGAGVSSLLAAIPLLDFVLVFPLAWGAFFEAHRISQYLGRGDGINEWSLFLPAFISLLAFFLARVLQKIAPAT